jgi:small Trp-rich protein
MKYLEFGPVANWSWTVVLAPFALAALWWAWADWSAIPRRRRWSGWTSASRDRIDKQRSALGIGPKKPR